jgi:hypothetical protein
LKYPVVNAPLAHAIARWSRSGARAGEASASIALERSWLPEADRLRLSVHYRFRREAWGTALAAEVDGVCVDLDAPVELATVVIPKPWGREIWYTGIEARGECAVRTPDATLPLSHYLALAPGHLVHGRALLLLKILDPRPEPVLGDLYFEVHREKQEVYVVTHVDRSAWPDGVGRMRFGMDPTLRARYADDDAFRRDYLQAVASYERLRCRIDAGEVVPDPEEQAARAAMECFTALRALVVGDVVAVPTWLPHSLQHGVRVVEFQTPTYERYIISFAQKVQTQDHWDSAFAVPRMTLDAPPAPDFETLDSGVERIVGFDDVRVWRVSLAPGQRFDLPAHPAYALCMTVAGVVTIGGLTLEAERAALVPGATLADAARRRALAPVHNPGPEPAVFLIAAPDL